MKAWLLPLCGGVLSGLLLSAAYAPWHCWGLAWFALLPLVVILPIATRRQAVFAAWVGGLVFWVSSMIWLRFVTVAGLLILSSYLSLYWLVWALFVRRWLLGSSLAFWRSLVGVGFSAAGWTALEWVRSVFLTGFPWNPLAVSQYQALPLIQIAEYTGVYGVTFLLAAMNMAGALFLIRIMRTPLKANVFKVGEMLLVLFVVFCVVFWGKGRLEESVEGTLVRVGVVQPNVPQYEKWTSAFVGGIFKTLEGLTKDLLRTRGVDLIVWPETALPDAYLANKGCYSFVHNLASNGVPLLVGSMHVEWDELGEDHWYNSAFLVDETGRSVGEYRKRHLVMFGEYIPFEEALPFIQSMSPIDGSFEAGTLPVVFNAEGDVPFGVQLCFEDAFPYVAREEVMAGARWLVTQTNDGWFDPGGGSWQHLTQGVFRSIENRVPTLRCGNTGISASIDPYGRVLEILANKRGEAAMFTGAGIFHVTVPGEDFERTFYTRHGDVFAWGMLLVALIGVGMLGRVDRGSAPV